MAVKAKRGSIDFYIFFALIVILGIGILMVFSASSVAAFNSFKDPYYWFRKQVIWVALGFIAMFIMINIDYKVWRPYAFQGIVVSVILLLIVLVAGDKTNGAVSWIKITPSIGFQPSELVKLFMVVYYADQFAKLKKYRKPKKVLRNVFGAGILIVLLVMKQPDFGTVLAMVLMTVAVFWAAGLPKQIFVVGVIAAVIGATAIFSGMIPLPDHVERRLAVYTDPWSAPLGDGYQAVQSMYAIGSGGLFGVGLGQSMQKYLWLPERHNDFIFSVIGEELGFIGCLLVILLYAIIINRGYVTATQLQDTYGSLLAVGITSMIMAEAVINISVVTGVMPVTGITLPFISYGGSSLVFKLIAMGLLLNITRYTSKNLDTK